MEPIEILTWSITEVRYVGGDIPKLVATEDGRTRLCAVGLHLHTQAALVPLGGGEVDDNGFLAGGVVQDVSEGIVFEVVVLETCVVNGLDSFHDFGTV